MAPKGRDMSRQGVRAAVHDQEAGQDLLEIFLHRHAVALLDAPAAGRIVHGFLGLAAREGDGEAGGQIHPRAKHT